MKLYSVFFGDDSRLRSGFRAAVFLFVYGTIGTLLAVIGYVAGSAVGIDWKDDKVAQVVLSSVAYLIPAIIVGWLCGKFLESLPFRAIGVSVTPCGIRDLITGLAIGAAAMGISVGASMISGGLSFTSDDVDGTAIARSLVVSFVIYALAAAFEEAVFRGYLLQTFTRSGLTWFAITATSAFFGMVHLGNRSATLFSTANTILAGILFGIAYLKTRNLWLPFGIHLMWNWMQGSIFGIEVSGMTFLSPFPLLKEIDRGPSWLTGESYGIEGSAACTVGLLLAMAIMYFLPIGPTKDIDARYADV